MTSYPSHPSFLRITSTIVLAGALSVVVWDLWAKVVAPFWMGGSLDPIGLVKSSLGIGKATFEGVYNAKPNAVGNAVANGLHYFTGLVGYPAAYIIVARPLSRKITPFLPWFVVAALYGTALWVFALYIMAHFFAGFPPFFGFNTLSQASLVGHVLLGLTIGAVVRHRLG